MNVPQYKAVHYWQKQSSQSAFGQSTGNDISGHHKRHYCQAQFQLASQVTRLALSLIITTPTRESRDASIS